MSQTKALEWEKRIKSWESSGQKQRVWCAEQGYGYEQFKYWRRRQKENQENPESSASMFTYVPVSNAPEESKEQVTGEIVALIRCGSLEMEIRGSGSRDFLWDLLREGQRHV